MKRACLLRGHFDPRSPLRGYPLGLHVAQAPRVRCHLPEALCNRHGLILMNDRKMSIHFVRSVCASSKLLWWCMMMCNLLFTNMTHVQYVTCRRSCPRQLGVLWHTQMSDVGQHLLSGTSLITCFYLSPCRPLILNRRAFWTHVVTLLATL